MNPLMAIPDHLLGALVSRRQDTGNADEDAAAADQVTMLVRRTIQTVSGDSDFSRIQELSMNMPLTHIHSVFTELTNIRRLELKFGNLASIVNLSALPHLEHLDVTRNQLRTIEPEPLLKLHTLILDSNPIERLAPEDLAGLPSLQRLSLAETRIAYLFPTVHALNALPRLVELTFEHPAPSTARGLVMRALSSAPGRYLSAHSDGRMMMSMIPSVLRGTASAITSVLSPSTAATEPHQQQQQQQPLGGIDMLMDEDEEDDDDLEENNDSGPALGQHQSSSVAQQDDTFNINFHVNDAFYHSQQAPFPGFGQDIHDTADLSDNGQVDHDNLDDEDDEDEDDDLLASDSPIAKQNTVWSYDAYRSYVVCHLPRLCVFNGQQITEDERQHDRRVYQHVFEHLPYQQQRRPSLYRLMMSREMGRSMSINAPSPPPAHDVQTRSRRGSAASLNGFKPHNSSRRGSTSSTCSAPAATNTGSHALSSSGSGGNAGTQGSHSNTASPRSSWSLLSRLRRNVSGSSSGASSGAEASAFSSCSDVSAQMASEAAEIDAALMAEQLQMQQTQQQQQYQQPSSVGSSSQQPQMLQQLLQQQLYQAQNLPAGSGKSELYDTRSTFTMESFRRSVTAGVLQTHRPSTHTLCPGLLGARQFEYHPTDPSLFVVGSMSGNLTVLNHNSGNVLGEIAPTEQYGILGLCWLRCSSAKFVAGGNNGIVRLYDVQRLVDGRDPVLYTYAPFSHLTSVHVNCTDDMFITSGYRTDVSLYDVRSGSMLRTLENLHGTHINVVKFANTNPNLFVSSSFDHSVKMWDLRQREPCWTRSSKSGVVMSVFSHDDRFVLSSAVDNEVLQLNANDGSLHTEFGLRRIKSNANFTRSYYMNDSDYVISGSCQESVVRVFSSSTGHFLTEVDLANTAGLPAVNSLEWYNAPYVQSLRGDPFRPFSLSALVAYNHPSIPATIVGVDFLRTTPGSPATGSAAPVA